MISTKVHSPWSYYRARYYNPQTGRFLSEDPIHFRGLDLNLYRYVENQPLIKKDPSGKLGILAILGIVAGVGFGAGVLGDLIGNPNSNTDSLLAAGAGGAAGATATAVLAGSAVLTGGASLGVVGGTCAILGGTAVGAGVNLLLTTPAQPDEALDKK